MFKHGLSFSNFPFRVMYIFLEEDRAPLQCGFAVSSKYFKKAVDRNRIKRLMREAWRLQKNGLAEALQENKRHMAVFFIYTGNTVPVYNDITEKMQSALKRLNKIAGEITASNT